MSRITTRVQSFWHPQLWGLFTKTRLLLLILFMWNQLFVCLHFQDDTGNQEFSRNTLRSGDHCSWYFRKFRYSNGSMGYTGVICIIICTYIQRAKIWKKWKCAILGISIHTYIHIFQNQIFMSRIGGIRALFSHNFQENISSAFYCVL